MKFLRDFDFKNKRVLVRVDFNVPLGDDGRVDEKEDWRLEAALPTIRYLLDQKAKIILLAHLGRPSGKIVESLRLDPIAKRLEELLNQPVVKLDDCLGQGVEERLKNIQAGEVFLLENLRFYPGEKNNQSDFAQQLAKLGEIYVSNAFGTIHRTHASIVGLPQHLPSCAGLLLEKEIKALSKILDEPIHPLVVIIGGVKISTKIKVIKNFLKQADNLILGGALANTVIRAKGLAIGKSVVEEAMIDEVKKLELTNTKLHIPVDVVASIDIQGQAPSRIVPVDKIKEKEMILDIGPDTIQLFNQIISQAKMIVWNGPMGVSEVDKFASGSRAVAQAVAQSSAFSVVGGGDTITLLEQLNLISQIDHISTGGGAMLKLLAKEKLPGIEALE
ncbi:MAG: phosphoglycerate kinase [Candidatus Portnoybacteria bacterium]|nr:phosphoglycerate kinase [Candidatus Portnoybacteria bacterium]